MLSGKGEQVDRNYLARKTQGIKRFQIETFSAVSGLTVLESEENQTVVEKCVWRNIALKSQILCKYFVFTCEECNHKEYWGNHRVFVKIKHKEKIMSQAGKKNSTQRG